MKQILALLLLALAGCHAAGKHYTQEGIDVVHEHHKGRYRKLKQELWAAAKRLKTLDKDLDKEEFEAFEEKTKQLMHLFEDRARAIGKEELAERWMHQHLDDFHELPEGATPPPHTEPPEQEEL